MQGVTVRQARMADLDNIAPLFDAYRQFYQQPADLALATAFIGERMREGESTVLLAEDANGQAVGFCQLYPSFCSVAAAPIHVLYDLFVAKEARSSGTGVIEAPASTVGATSLTCVVNVDRSRITNSDTKDVPFTWAKDGCVNGRTQYGLMDGKWSRIFVPSDEAVVSVNTYDPDKREYRVERFLLGSDAMSEARTMRETYKAPACGTGESGAVALGTSQAAIFALLPPQPNERLIFDCSEEK